MDWGDITGKKRETTARMKAIEKTDITKILFQGNLRKSEETWQNTQTTLTT